MTSPVLSSNLYQQLQCTRQQLEAGFYNVKTTCQLFEEQVARVPKQIALLYKDLSISYEELNERTNQLARYIRQQYKQLTARELKTNTLIPISIGRSAEFVIGILGIIKAGAAYVPINPEYPDNRIRHILKDIDSKIIITEAHLANKFKAFNEKLLAINLDQNLFINEKTSNLDVPLSPNDLAYVIYTSGSSGTPKGVLAKHITLISQTVCASYFSANESDTVAFFSDVSFDSTTTEIWGALLSGARLFIPHNFFDLLSNPKLFKETALENKISVILLTRSLFDLLYTLDETVFASVRLMMVGAEALTKSIMLKLSQSIYKPSILINAYGPTENSTFCTTYNIYQDFSLLNSVPIGRPYSNRIGLVLDKHLQLLPIGITGELFVGGTSLSNGYLNQAELTAEKFIPNRYFDESGEKYPNIYKTNDLVKWLPEGYLEYIGRNDFMVKLRGYRIELGEIETRLLEFPEIKHTVVLLEENNTLSYLVGYYVADQILDEKLLKDHLALTLPDYMLPSIFVHMATLPVTTNGKLDRKALPKPFLKEAPNKSDKSRNLSIKQTIQDIWSATLNIHNFDSEQSFFDLGGNSLAAMIVRNELETAFAIKINIVELFQYNNLSLLSERISELLKVSGIKIAEKTSIKLQNDSQSTVNEAIAIVGMACRIPGASDPDSFWKLLANGDSNLVNFTDEILKEKQVNDSLIANKSYVKRGALLEDCFKFDAGFFGYSVKDAEIMDPQHRLFLECAWEALEYSANVPEKFKGEIAVFASQGRNNYFIDQVYNSVSSELNLFQAILGNEKDFLSTRVSFKLNLTGPSITTQTACSSSLVSIQQACESLKTQGCDMALAGGSSVFYNYGYLHQEELIESPDGYCRAFDKKAKGTVVTSGVGLVALKRLSDAIAQKDTIYAVIKGGAVNNDGSAKMAFTAPSVQGQSAVIEKALKNAKVSPATISYIEAHGTGTTLGDPIEWTALHDVYQKYSDQAEYCTIGSVKTNIGHTDSAAGVFGLIKTSLALKHRLMPATLNFEALNPEIASFNKLFRVSNQTEAWQSETTRRAAVSSFGLGGTNAHLILEEAPQLVFEKDLYPSFYLIPLSAKNRESLYGLATKFKNFLTSIDSRDLKNVAYTAQFGRAEFQKRGYLLVSKQLENQNYIALSYLHDDDYFDLAMVFFVYLEVIATMLKISSKVRDNWVLKLIDIIDVLFMQLIGLLWVNQIPIDWQKINKFSDSSRKISIPGYCFIRKHYEIPKIKSNSTLVQTISVEESESLHFELKSMWSKVLGIPAAELTASSDFLKLGGDSLAFVDLYNYLKKAYFANFSLEDIIKYNEFGPMCQYLNSRMIKDVV
ncbi:MAG: amino acid adenylation domain-containing protein [Tatlockia sp.]|nr:amino acid adenylation domain-containing protein [Tatlockia sp.]